MTSISMMEAYCPECKKDIRDQVYHLGIGDSEDTDEIICGNCGATLDVEILARFDVRKQ